MVKMCVIMLQVVEGPTMHDQIVFYAFHSFLVEVLRMCNSKLEIRIPITHASNNKIKIIGIKVNILQLF